jgi:hypothetical protein
MLQTQNSDMDSMLKNSMNKLYKYNKKTIIMIGGSAVRSKKMKSFFANRLPKIIFIF